MDTFEAIESRRSVRQFKPERKITDEELNRILHSAVMAPSAGNTQCWRFVVVRSDDVKNRLATEAGHQHFINQAPLAIVVCADLARAHENYGARGRDTYALQETAAAVQNMLLAAKALGLGACWVGSFDEKKASEILDLKENIRPLAIIPIGVAAEPTKRVPPRRNVKEVVDFR
jgi:nitroreductase